MNRRLLVQVILLSMVLTIILIPKPVYAEVPYKTYTHDAAGGNYNIIETQAAYLPGAAITKIGETSFAEARDMVITKDGYIYIADTGNRRILVSDLKGNYIREFGKGVLITPCGVFVTDDKLVYVADRDAKKVFVFDQKGNVISEYGKPNHPLYGDEVDFLPLKIVVNHAGNMFVICESNTNGIVQISPTQGGTFLGYYGTNPTSISIIDIIIRMFMTDAQRAKMIMNRPPTPDNHAIDEKGLIYTVTRGQSLETLRRLNIAGKNIMQAEAYDETPAAVISGNYDNVYMVSNQGYIYEFNNEGNLLFVFGGRDDGRQRIGLSKRVEAIGVDHEDKLYILDSDLNQIQIFEPTEFTDLLHEALYLYSKGRYTESKEPLEQILEMNSLFGYANKAMGLAYLQEENYDMAMHYAKLASDRDTYSDAFWEERNLWLIDNLISTMFLLVVLYIIFRVLKHLHKKKGVFNKAYKIIRTIKSNTLVSRLRYSLYFMKHPIDGCYGVRWEGKASYVSANILLAIFIVFNIINKYFTSFLFKTVREGRYNISSDIGLILLVFIVLTACNYLVCTINDGEGSFKQIYCSFVYCLTPYLVLRPFVFVLSRIVTMNERFLVTFSESFLLVWVIVLLVITIKELNNISVKETIKVILLTFFTALIFMLLVFILYVLWQQVYDFITGIGGEVVYRLGF
ncbi:MAG: hypothetical protein EWM47_05360 [Anaerolineaceae bacterium]|nr:MAG: hypothetical protein EWM47_05360 [Anaerolineaceae bacterium]